LFAIIIIIIIIIIVIINILYDKPGWQVLVYLGVSKFFTF